jgi:hypothetical protein
MRFTPEIITELLHNEVFVYGTNNLAQHDGGAAKSSLKWGSIYGDCPIGLCGNTYGIVTTSFNDQPITLAFIQSQIETLYQFAYVRPDLIFLVTKIGCGIAGWSINQIAPLFTSLVTPSNIILPKEFTN